MQSAMIRYLRFGLAQLARRAAFRVAMPLVPVLGFWIGGSSGLLAGGLGAAGLVAMSSRLRWWPRLRLSRRSLSPQDDSVPLRQSLLDEIAANLETARIAGMQTAVMVLSLDDAAALRATLGQTAQEEFVHHLNRRLKTHLRGGDFVARLDSETLGVALLPQYRMDDAMLQSLAGRLQRHLARPLRVNDIWTEPSVSVGFCAQERVALPVGAAGALALLHAAEIAAERAQDAGPRGACGYASGMESAASRQRALAQALTLALEDRAIIAHFQPQVDSRSGAVCGMEALVRWQRDGAFVPPAAFLPDIYALGLAERLMQRVLEDALDALVVLDDAGLHVPRVAINLSATELSLPQLADTVLWEVESRGLAPERLGIEVLESVVAGAPEQRIERSIARLAAAGCGIDLDDFGTGHASITNLRHFAVSRLKIDRGFVSGVDTDPAQRRLVAAIISMARELSLDTLAEGVETPAQARVLAELDCPALQGFSIARPMALEDLADWLRARQSGVQSGAQAHQIRAK